MKRNIMKKTMLCALSLSFALLLASCKKATNEQSVSKTNIFANKDILAYAKKESEKGNNKKQVYQAIDSSKYNVISNNSTYALLKDVDTDENYLFICANNNIVDLKNGSSDSVDDVTAYDTIDDVYGYFNIDYDSGNQMVIDYKGEVIVEKGEYNDISFNRLISESINDGPITFYDIITCEKTSDNVTTIIYKIDATIENGYISSEFTRTKVESADDIDYSVCDKTINDSLMPLKEYDITYINKSIIVKDLKGNLKSSLTLDISSSPIALDDKLMYQTKETVTINDDYTYFDGTSYVLLKTYQFDLSSGKTTEIKDYGYVIGNANSYILGYNEKKDRNYIAGIYASLQKIDDKRLSKVTINATIDKNGKILSTKIGEVGNGIAYLNDNTYVLYNNSVISLLDKKGNAKINLFNSNIRIDYENELIFMPASQGYYILDTDLKLLETESIKGSSTLNALFSDSYALTSISGQGGSLVKFEGKKVEVVDRFDYIYTTSSLISSGSILSECKYVITNDTLTYMNMYLVETKTTDGVMIQVYSSNGEEIASYDNVINLSFDKDTTIKMTITNSTAAYYYGSTTLSQVENN